MKTNPWMIVSLVLAFACGCMVGSKPENEAEAAKQDWAYSMSTIWGSIVTMRWDRSLENPMPEIMVFPANTYNHKAIEKTPGKWCKVEMVEEEEEPSGLEDVVILPTFQPWTPEEIEDLVNLDERTEEERQALREAYRKANEEWEPMTEEEVEAFLARYPDMLEENKQKMRETQRRFREERGKDN